MTPWIRTRHVWSVGAAVIVCAAGLELLRDDIAPAPLVMGSNGIALWSTFLPLVWAIAVADSFSSKLQSAEVRPSRRTLAFDTALLLAMAGIGVAVFTALAGPDASAAAAAGHVLTMTGLACAFTLLGGAGAGVLASSALLILTTFYAVDAPGGRYVRVFQPDGEPMMALLVGLAACLVACALILVDGARIRLGATEGLGG